jgi:hypothetical protein
MSAMCNRRIFLEWRTHERNASSLLRRTFLRKFVEYFPLIRLVKFSPNSKALCYPAKTDTFDPELRIVLSTNWSPVLSETSDIRISLNPSGKVS